MPRNVRNFWIELEVDGATKRIETGPRANDGGFKMTIKMRNEGDVLQVAEINGGATPNGNLTLSVMDKYQGQPVWDFTTTR